MKWIFSFILTIFFPTLFLFPINCHAMVSEKEIEARQLMKNWDSSSINRSISLFSEAADEFEANGEFQKTAVCLRESANLAMISSDYQTATYQLQKALKFDREANFTEGQIINLSLLSRVKNQEGKIEESKEFYEKALNLADSTDSFLAKANAFFSAAEYGLFFGNVSETISLYEKALYFAEKTDAHGLAAQILINLGYSHLRQGNLIVGLQKQNESLALAEKANDKRAQAIALNGVASLYIFMGEKRKALDIFLKAETMYPNDFDWLEKGKLFNGIATIYEDYGEFRLAEMYRQNAYDFFGRAKYPYGQLATLPVLAKHQYLKGDKHAGEKLYADGLNLAKELKSDFHLGIIKEDLGSIYLGENDQENAIKNYKEALEIYKKINIEMPRINTLLGQAYLKTGNFVVANEYFNAALTKNKQTKDLSPAAENLFYLAKLNYLENNADSSLKNIVESLEITEALYVDVSNFELKTTFFANIFERYELFIHLLMQKHKNFPNENFAFQALQATEKSRARATLENLILSEANFVKDANPETIKQEKEIRSLININSDNLTELLMKNADQKKINELELKIRQLNYQLEEIKTELKQNSPLYSEIKSPKPFEKVEFQQKILDDNTVFLEFSLGQKESYLWLIGNNSFYSYVLPPRFEIENHIEKLRELLGARIIKPDESLEDYQNRLNAAENEYRSIAKLLSNELFGQIADKISNKRLIIVPDGKLHYFPVSALPFPNSESDEPILITNETVYAPSAQTLLFLERTRTYQAENAKNLLIYSDPIYTEKDSRFPDSKIADETKNDVSLKENFRFVETLNSLPRLAASKIESDSILEIIGTSNNDSFSGFEANRTQLLNSKLDEYKIIHFATHGFSDEKRPELSGIVLSRFDERGKQRDEFFRIHDIYGLNLNADLVVLSACETGLGKEVKGEGLMSLNNAFLQTGAKTVMSSLWKVEDTATLELMKNFYGAMAEEKLTPSQALRQAQIKLRQNSQFRSPFYWAAFTVQGDFRNVPQISPSFNKFYYLFALILFILIGAIFLYRKKFYSKN